MDKATFAAAAEYARQHRHDRRPSLGGRVAGLDALHAHLSDAARSYDDGSLEDKREAVYQSLASVQNYLYEQGFELATLEPIIRPALALLEAQRGNIDDVFTVKRAKKPPRTLARMVRYGTLAALAQQWLDFRHTDKRKQDLLFQEASRRMTGPWFGTVRGGQLKKYREMAHQEAATHPTRAQYERILRQIKFTEQFNGAELAFTTMVNHQNNTYACIGKGEASIPKTPHVLGNG